MFRELMQKLRGGGAPAGEPARSEPLHDEPVDTAAGMPDGEVTDLGAEQEADPETPGPV